MANIDAAFKQDILDLAQCQWVPVGDIEAINEGWFSDTMPRLVETQKGREAVSVALLP